MRVLLVTQRERLDDLVGAFEHADIAIHRAVTQEHALTQIASRRADAVLIDIELPGLAAVELLGVIKSRHPRVPVVTFTARAGYEKETIEALTAIGSDAHLQPPFDTSNVIQLIADSTPAENA